MIKFIDLRPTGNLKLKLDAAYERVMTSARYIGGAEVEAFEHEWAEYCEAAHCVACGNGFDALQLILRALVIISGDSVLVPAWTATPTWAAVEVVGAKPAPTDGWIDESNQALIRVHLYGLPSPIQTMADRPLPTIEDCAQSHGLTIDGHKLGSFGLCAWSFYPTKNLGAYGDAGAITTNGDALAEQLRALRSYGCPGAINSRMDPLQAAFLRVKLPYLDGWNARRREIAARYLDGLRGVPFVDLPIVPEWCEPVWHQFVIRSTKRDDLRAYLAERGIETMIHYPVPPHRALGYDYDLPEADRLAAEVLSLPVAPHLTDEEAGRVIQAIREWGTV
jgi:dTDP-3-amino-3,4,6-trideoxy-alpha-D-glucose transaminase